MRKPDAKVVVAVWGRRAGKTTGAVEALMLLGLERRVKVGWFAPVSKATRVAWEHACSVIPRSALLDRSETEKSLLLVNGSRFQFFSLDEPDNVLGWGFDLVLLDEGARVSKYARDEIVAPMVADRDGTLVAITTPKGRTGRGGWVWRDFQRAKQGLPGYYWLAGPSTQNPLPSIRSWVKWAKDNLPDRVYRQEILAEFLEQEEVILDLRPACVGGGSEGDPCDLPFEMEPSPGRHSLGCDLAKVRDWTVVTAVDLETGQLRYADRFHRMSWEMQVHRVLHAQERYAGVLNVDATGLGEPVVEMMERAGLVVNPVKFTVDSKTELVESLIVAIERSEFTMPWIEQAVAEADTLECDLLSSGRVRYRAAEGFHDDFVMSLGLAVHGLRHRVRGVPV